MEMDVGQLSVEVLDQRHSGPHRILDNVEVADGLLVYTSPDPWLLSDSVPAVVVPSERIEGSKIIPSCTEFSSCVEDEATDV